MTSDRGDWMQLISGKPFFPSSPCAEEIEIGDIAWALSMQCRYAGHVKRFYSVAEHCVHLSYAVPSEFALWALLHDAAESYLTDLPLPVKQGMPNYKRLEEQLMRCVAKRFGLSLPEPEIVKEFDTRILLNERDALLNASALDWKIIGDPLPGIEIYGWHPQEACDRFLERYEQLVEGSQT